MPPTHIDQLFDNSRFPQTGFGIIALILYFPIGFVLAFVRIFIGFHALVVLSLLPKAWWLRCLVLRVMCGVLGILVVQEHPDSRDRNARVIVVNYTTPLDRLAVELIYPCIMPSMWDLPATMMWLLGYEDMGAKQGRETLVQNAKRHCRDSPYPLLAFPEGATTNGKVGLLKFSVWPFSLDENVQPVVIRISRPSVLAVSPSVAGSWWWTDIFWFLFVPYSCFHLRVLPVVAQLEDETMQEFALRIQRFIAESMSISATPYTSADKIEHIKRQETTLDQNRRQARPNDCLPKKSATVNSEMDLLVNQVKGVLPNVPAQVIRQDLSLTKDVDLTITNILEGRVQYKAEEPGVEADRAVLPVQATHKQSTSKSTSKSPQPAVITTGSKQSAAAPATTSSSSFGRTTAERHMTFAERKKALIETARQRYLEKNSLNETTSPFPVPSRHQQAS